MKPYNDLMKHVGIYIIFIITHMPSTVHDEMMNVGMTI